MKDQPMYLLLENGQVFEGKSFGAPLHGQGVLGEVVFTTSMTGYLETITDPSYYGQLVVQTFPLIGNYGVIPHDFESDRPYLSAYLVRDWCRTPSNFRCEGDLGTFFVKRGIPAMYDVDTRALTKILRESGTMNGMILAALPSSDEEKQTLLSHIRSFRITRAVEHACREGSRTQGPVTEPAPAYLKPTEYEKEEESEKTARWRIGLWDFGAKQNIIRELCRRGCLVTTIAPDTKAEEIMAMGLDGLMLSNGPGDPAENTAIIAEIKKLVQACRDGQLVLPMFGICLGHQLMALAHGASTGKLKYGHRGANQPVRDVQTGRITQTSQNHGYAVLSESLPPEAKQRYINLNDGTNEGIDYTDHPCFTVQFHPEASGGPLDTSFLFDRFLGMVEETQQGIRKETRKEAGK